MNLNLIKSLIVFLFGFLVMFLYYVTFNHLEFGEISMTQAIASFIYFIIVFVIYFVYKKAKINKSLDLGEKNISYSIMELIAIFFIQLFLLSGIFYVFNNTQGVGDAIGVFFSGGIPLFFKIILFSLFPVYIGIVTWTFGKKILSYLHGFSEQSNTFQNIFSVVFGFSFFVFILVCFGIIGFYNPYILFVILVVLNFIGFRQCQQLMSTIFETKIQTNQQKHFSSYIFSSEFFYFIVTFVLSINFITILRPFPMGWDDLGVYMNYPQLFANAGEILMLGGMHSWQVFTGVGYMFGSPTQAFFLNSLGIIFSFLFLWAIFQKYLSSKNNRQFINIPLILSTIFVSMPMVIFQQAKDIKHDAGLFFLSIGIIYVVFEIIRKQNFTEYKNKFLALFGNKNHQITSQTLLFLGIGFVVGFTFTLKFTSLLYILALFGVLFFARLSYIGLFGFLALFVAIFTKLNLWGYMNIVYSTDNTTAINIFSGVTFISAMLLLGYSFYKNKKIIGEFLAKISAMIVGIIIAIAPWGLYNLSSSENFSISSIISGTSQKVEIDYNDVYSPEELELKEEQKQQYDLSATGTTANEDWGRYLGYQEGLNNFIFMPYNLSMQANQKGEFTDITYLYFALLPLVLLFLPLRKKSYLGLVTSIFIFELAVFFIPATSIFFQNIFSQIVFPLGYLILFIGFLIPFFILMLTIKDDEKTSIFKYNLVFAFIYIFLWTISAYGVVWYGIVMYFNLLLVIGFGLYYACSFSTDETQQVKQSKSIITVALMCVIGVYFVFSVIPHGLINLKNAGYREYKSGQIATVEAPFLYNPDYLTILFETNIHPEKQKAFIDTMLNKQVSAYIDALNKQNQQTKNQGEYIFIDKYNIDQIEEVLRQMARSQSVSLKDLKPLISQSLENIYHGILNPTEEFKNDKNIYRIGTFLKYYISDNHKRLFEDSLVMNFYSYILGGNPDETVQNMKDLGLEYFLVDLNAATIDNDERRNLTNRYESLLRTFTSQNLELISTDSKCLQAARETYLTSDKTLQDYSMYLAMAGVNYDSYENGEKIPRANKRVYCYNTILSLIEDGKVDANNYSYLLPIQNYLLQNPEMINNVEQIYAYMKEAVPHGYKAFFKIK